VAGNYADFTYWGPSSTAAGVNKKAVNWDGYNHISDQNYLIRNALDCYCTGSNWCYIAAHSAGDLMIGYTLAMYGGSSRTITNATPNSSGVCSASGAGTQTGWNIKWVDIAAGAAGGSELADLGDWALSEPLVSDLKTTTARAMYDHSSTRATWFYMYAGASGTLYSAVLPGQDDEAWPTTPRAASRQQRRGLLQPQRLVLQRPDAGHRGQRGRPGQVGLPLGQVPRRQRGLQPLHQRQLGRGGVAGAHRHGQQRALSAGGPTVRKRVWMALGMGLLAAGLGWWSAGAAPGPAEAPHRRRRPPPPSAASPRGRPTAPPA
jgi:hypothetical protein